MAISERDRHDMHAALRKTIGKREADTLMEHLPPVGWADVATKRDLEVTKRDLETQLGSLRHEFRADMERGFRRIIMWNTTVVIAGMGLAATIGSLL